MDRGGRPLCTEGATGIVATTGPELRRGGDALDVQMFGNLAELRARCNLREHAAHDVGWTVRCSVVVGHVGGALALGGVLPDVTVEGERAREQLAALCASPTPALRSLRDFRVLDLADKAQCRAQEPPVCRIVEALSHQLD